MIVDGRAIAKEVLDEAKKMAQRLEYTPSFVAYVIEPSPATMSYLRMKQRQAEEAGIDMTFCELSASTTTEELIARVQRASEDAVIVQLPLPEHIDMMRVLDAIPEEKDADVLSMRARERALVLHPIAASVENILNHSNISIIGVHAVVVGEGWLVGRPVADWLTKAGAQVTVVTKESGDLEDKLPQADVVVSGAGSPGIITPNLVKEGAVVIDIGTSELGGSIAGDVDPSVAEKAGLYTPVPGGVGPIAVAYLMKNVIDLALKRSS